MRVFLTTEVAIPAWNDTTFKLCEVFYTYIQVESYLICLAHSDWTFRDES
jgi:hypothetical protein